MNFLQSRVSQLWVPILDSCLRDNNVYDEKHTGTICLQTILVTITEQFFTLWDSRNQLVHGIDLQSQKESQRQRLLAEIRNMSAQRHLILSRDRDLFPDEELVAKQFEKFSPTFLKNWIQTWKPVFKQSHKEADRLALRQVPSIRSFFNQPEVPPSSSRPPKPRYSKHNHRRHDRPRTRHKASVYSQPITKFFAKQSPP